MSWFKKPSYHWVGGKNKNLAVINNIIHGWYISERPNQKFDCYEFRTLWGFWFFKSLAKKYGEFIYLSKHDKYLVTTENVICERDNMDMEDFLLNEIFEEEKKESENRFYSEQYNNFISNV